MVWYSVLVCVVLSLLYDAISFQTPSVNYKSIGLSFLCSPLTKRKVVV